MEQRPIEGDEVFPFLLEGKYNRNSLLLCLFVSFKWNSKTKKPPFSLSQCAFYSIFFRQWKLEKVEGNIASFWQHIERGYVSALTKWKYLTLVIFKVHEGLVETFV